MRLAGRYEILGLIGVGGMGSVYRAHDSELDEVVALKMLRRELVSDGDMLARFRQEVKLARRVTHRNVARTFDIGEHEGEKFLTMEYVEGESLAAALARRGAFAVAEAVGVASEICGGLAAAHEAGVVHRDLKPDNVLLATDGRVVLTDFGIARLVPRDASSNATQGVVTGTPAYMAPEQVEGGAIDARVDVYAVGEILFEMLAGAPAWTGTSIVQVAAARLYQPPPDLRAARIDAPDALVAIVARAMARRPDERFASAADLGRALAGLTLPQTSMATPPRSGVVVVHEPAVPVADVTQASDKTLAVLPFKNGGPPEDAYLAEGLTEDLVDALSAVSGLRVRPLASVQKLAADGDPREAGQTLGVQVVAAGSVRRAGDALRVTARLVSVGDGFQLWAGRFDTTVSAILSVGDQIANAIGEALLVERNAPARDAPTNPAALELYLRAKHELKISFREGTQRAIGLLTEALRLAPRDPVILSAFALALVREVTFGDNADAAESVARGVVQDAVRIAPHLPEPHLALAALELAVGASESGARSLARSLSLGRAGPDAHDLLGTVLSECGPLDLAAKHMELALALEPRFHHTRAELARIYELLGNTERAELLVDNAPHDAALATGFWISRARTLCWQRDVATAKALLAREGEAAVRPPARTLLEVLANGQNSPEADHALRVRLSNSDRALRRRAVFSLLKAEFFAFLGEHATALEAIEVADRAGTFNAMWFEHCPLLDAFESEPRFRDARARTLERAAAVRAALAV